MRNLQTSIQNSNDNLKDGFNEQLLKMLSENLRDKLLMA